jgi:exodeoxyribonuclease VII small subunit
MAKATPSVTEPSFETALERLEQIVQEMEGDRLALEDLLARYEEGTRLVKVCQRRLEAAEKRIELISKDPSGAVVLSDFDPANPPTGGAGTGASGTGSRSGGASAGRKPEKSAPEDISLF